MFLSIYTDGFSEGINSVGKYHHKILTENSIGNAIGIR
jgi:hypothetical protein